MKLVLIRHGETKANRMIEEGVNLYTGCLNNELTDLTPEAIKMAKQLSNQDIIKKINKVYVSDLKRAIDTAKYVNPNFNYIIVPDVRERSLGDFEGKTKEELLSIDKYKKYFEDENYMEFRTSFTQKAPNGENYTEVLNRCMKFLNSLKYSNKDTIGIISHLAAIRCMMLGILSFKPRENVFRLKIKNCVPYVFEGEEISKLKLTSHNLNELL